MFDKIIYVLILNLLDGFAKWIVARGRYLLKLGSYAAQKYQETAFKKATLDSGAPLYRKVAQRVLNKLECVFWKSVALFLCGTIKAILYLVLVLVDNIRPVAVYVLINGYSFYLKAIGIVTIFLCGVFAALVATCAVVIVVTVHFALFTHAQMQRYLWVIRAPALSLQRSYAREANL
jgi:hypothetical protein